MSQMQQRNRKPYTHILRVSYNNGGMGKLKLSLGFNKLSYILLGLDCLDFSEQYG